MQLRGTFAALIGSRNECSSTACTLFPVLLHPHVCQPEAFIFEQLLGKGWQQLPTPAA